jgi:hypothetical protein
VLPVPDDVRHWHASPRAAVGFLLHAATLDGGSLGNRRCLTMPGVSVTVAEQIAALRRTAGEDAARVIRREPSPAVELLGTISEIGVGSFTAQGLRIATNNAQFTNPGGIDFSPAPPPIGVGTLVARAYDAAAGIVTASLVVAGLAVRSRASWPASTASSSQGAATRLVGDVAVDTTDVATPLAVGMRVAARPDAGRRAARRPGRRGRG